MRIRSARPVGEDHLKLSFTDGGPAMDAIAFDAGRRGLDALQTHQGRPVHLAGRVELNHWNGRTRVQLRLEDAAWAE
jgi:single-stranded-DNA-specific exonuclease